jgi:predicted NBD/HSP70 family sugar kinase
MRRIHPDRFTVARRGLPREINRQIVLSLVRARQPVSRADLARLMGTHRAAVSLIVNALIAEGLLFEGARGESPRGRKPMFLYINSRKRCVLAVDIRPTRTSLMITDLLGEPVGAMSSFATVADPDTFIRTLAERATRTLEDHQALGPCEGIGVVVPGMVDRAGDSVLFAPRLGWRNVPLRAALSKLTGLPVHIENSGRACALALVWGSGTRALPDGDVVFLSVSDGLGVGVVVRGELMRGHHNVAGEFGHVPINVEGPTCACGASGCLEAYVSNLATLSRYFGRELSPREPIPPELASFSVDDLIARVRSGDGKAIAALQATAHYLGCGIAALVNTIDPVKIYLSGEIMAAWDLIEPTVRQALAARALPPTAARIDLVPVPAGSHPRLRGAAALVAAPLFAAPAVA